MQSSATIILYDKKKRATTQTSLDPFFKRVDRTESGKEPEPVPSTSGVSEISLCLLLLTILQLYHLPPPLPPPVSNSSCLFTRCQPLCGSCCTTVLFKVLYCEIKNVFFIFCVCFLCIVCVKSIINLLQYSTI